MQSVIKMRHYDEMVQRGMGVCRVFNYTGELVNSE